MDRVEYYSGERVGSPENFVDPMDSSGQFAINARDLYSYQSQGRQPSFQYNYPQMQYQQPQMFMNQPQPMNFGAMGYNNPGYYQQQFTSVPMNTPRYNPGQQQGYQMGVQTMNPNQINTGFVGNPAFGLLQQWQQQGTPYQGPQGYYNPYTQQVFRPVQPQSYSDRVVEVPGYNPLGGNAILPANIKEICEQMDVDMMLEQQEAMAKRAQRSQGYYNNNMYGYMNYYGAPFIGNYYDSSITNKYMDKVQEIKREAIERKKELNKTLSRLVHNYLKDGVTEADINRIYDGYSYTIPGSSIQEYETQERLYRTVPFNNASMYQQHSAQVSYLYHMIAPAGRNMNEFFQDAGMFFTIDRLVQEQHRRRNTKNYYDRSIYHEYLRKYAIEHELEARDKEHTKEVAEKLTDLALEKGDKVTKQDIMNVLYTPQEIERLRNQGLIIHPDGSTEIKAPDSILQSMGIPNYEEPSALVVNAENELDYEMRRSAFINSIYNNNRSQVGG